MSALAAPSSGNRIEIPPRNSQSISECRPVVSTEQDDFTSHGPGVPRRRQAARVLPHEPPKSNHRSMPRCSRSSSMSATRCCVVFVERSVSGKLACGVLCPQPRWSNSTTLLGRRDRKACPGHPERASAARSTVNDDCRAFRGVDCRPCLPVHHEVAVADRRAAVPRRARSSETSSSSMQRIDDGLARVRAGRGRDP